MSNKRNVTTFQISLVHSERVLEGPVVSPDRRRVAENLEGIHRLCLEEKGLMVYDRQWIYLPAAAVLSVCKGSRFFALPWPLRDGEEQDDGS